MNDFSSAMAMSSSGMQAQAGRLRHVSENIANADTPGYQRKTVAFEQIARGENAGRVHVGPTQLDQSALVEVFDPDNPLSDTDGYYQGSNVKLLVEIADAREAHRSYEANLRVFEQTRQMSSSLMDLLRR